MKVAIALELDEDGRAADAAPVPVGPTAMPPRPSVRPRAEFVAHVVATAMRCEQTRERRRLDPLQASLRYLKTGGGGLPLGRMACRDI